MTILIATDSFKDALPALEVCEAIERGLKLAEPRLTTRVFPMADGGEGTAEILTYHQGGKIREIEVNDPLFRPVMATYGCSKDGHTAFIDMARASGLQHLSSTERDPMLTSTFGTGELLLAAIRQGARRILLGIGGSATNDVGMGMAAALGYRFLDAKQKELLPIGGQLDQVREIDATRLYFDPNELEIIVLCDVDNPLYGPAGAACIYGPQKGADAVKVQLLDDGARHFNKVLEAQFGTDFAHLPGAGAAGGMGAGSMAFLGAALRPGIETVMEYSGFERALENADLLITGEGRIDQQTLHGKLIHGLCKRAHKKDIPVLALCGALNAGPKTLRAIGLQAAFSILNGPMLLEDALNHTEQLLEQTAFSVMQTILMGGTNN